MMHTLMCDRSQVPRHRRYACGWFQTLTVLLSARHQLLSTILAFRSPQPVIVIEEILEIEKGSSGRVGRSSLAIGRPWCGYVQTICSNSPKAMLRFVTIYWTVAVLECQCFLLTKQLQMFIYRSPFSLTLNRVFKSLKSKSTDDTLYQLPVGYSGLYFTLSDFSPQKPRLLLPVSNSRFQSCHSIFYTYSLIDSLSVRQHRYSQFCQEINHVLALQEAISGAKEHKMCEALSKVRKTFVAALMSLADQFYLRTTGIWCHQWVIFQVFSDPFFRSLLSLPASIFCSRTFYAKYKNICWRICGLGIDFYPSD